MSDETEPILDNKKLLEKITNLEQLSQELFSLQNEYKINNDILLKNKEFINYLYEHQNVKDLNFYMLYPNMNIVNNHKNGIFHEIKRKDSIQYIQNIISNSIKSKANFDSKSNEIKKKIVDLIEDPVEVDILDKEIYDIILPLISKKFPNYFKNNNEDEDEGEIDD